MNTKKMKLIVPILLLLTLSVLLFFWKESALVNLKKTYSATLFYQNDGMFWLESFDFYFWFCLIGALVGIVFVVSKNKIILTKRLRIISQILFLVIVISLVSLILFYYSGNDMSFYFILNRIPITIINFIYVFAFLGVYSVINGKDN